MSNLSAEAITKLRSGIDIKRIDQAQQILYESWLARDEWRLDSEALPLLIGVSPDQWQAHVDKLNAATVADTLCRCLAQDLGCEPQAKIAAIRLRQWTRDNAVALPDAFARILDFIVQVLPLAGAADEQATQIDAAQDRELILGAALALVTRFPRQCLDDNGFFDGTKIADAILTQAARWFPLQPPQLDRDEIALLLETYLQ